MNIICLKDFQLYIFYFFILFFLLVGGYLLYNIVVVFVIHWQESAMILHVFPIPIPPPISLLKQIINYILIQVRIFYCFLSNPHK